MAKMIEQLESRTLFASYSASTATQLIAAINSANSSGAADTITLAAGATFSLTAVDNSTSGATGLPQIAGGIYIGSGASAGLDAFTVKHTTQNKATNDRNIAGLYELLN